MSTLAVGDYTPMKSGFFSQRENCPFPKFAAQNLKAMATIRKVLLRREQKNSKKHAVGFRLSLSRGRVFRLKTYTYIKSDFWDAKKEKVTIPRSHTDIQRELLGVQKQLDELASILLEECIKKPEEEICKEWLEHVIHVFYFGEDVVEAVTESESFYETLDTFISMRVKKGNRTNQFHCLKRMLQRFEIYRGGGYKIGLDDLTDLDLEKFKDFLLREHSFFDKDGTCIKYARVYKLVPESRRPRPRGLNGIHYILKRLRTFYNWAVKTGRTTNNPFTKYQIPPCVYGTPYYMTLEERNKLFDFDFSATPQLAVQRDIFVFQSCVGMRTGDLYRLTRDNWVGNTIEYIANKTMNERGDTVSVPLTSQAQIILARYKDENRDALLPFISQQHYNKAIKEMLKKAGIDRVVTILNPITRQSEQHPIYEVASTYMARRNFIGNLYKQVKDANLIGSLTGHVEGSKAFARYRAIDADMKKEVISKLE